jgi:peroxiredoxin
MKLQKHSLAGLLLLLVLVAACESGSAPNPPAGIGLQEGQLAPDFTLKTLTGEEVTLSSYRGKNPVYLVFWATWCPYCVKEIPQLKELYSKFAPKGLKIIAINIGLNDPMIRVQAFQKQFALPYTIVYDANTVISRQYGVIGVPFGVLVDRNGKVRSRSSMIPENFEALLEKEKPV